MARVKNNVSIILKRDIKGLGSAGEIKSVAAGYARNFLLPRKLVLIATPSIVASAQAKIEREKAQKAKELTDAQNSAKKLEGREVVLRVKAGQKGKLFGSINKKEIIEGLKNQHSASIKAEQIDLAKPLRTLGKHSVTIKLAPEVSATITIQIVSAKN